MYLVGQGHEHLGPGTSMVQRINWTQNQENELRGMGCAGCKGKCGGMGCAGLGLFDSGFDPSGWGAMEWATVGLGAYVLFSTVFTTKRAARNVTRRVKKFRRRRRAAAVAA